LIAGTASSPIFTVEAQTWAQDIADRAQTLLVQMAQMDLVPPQESLGLCGVKE
jgi:hypothetical protein